MNSTPLLSNAQLIDMLSFTKTPTAVHVGEEATIQFANDAMINVWGKDKSVIGKSLAQALPELNGQPFIEMFAKVWREGITLSGSDTAADLVVDGETVTVYFDFEYRAILDDKGKTICILHTAVDVTERFLKRTVEEKAQQTSQILLREQQSNEQLSAAFEELRATNEELQQTRDTLQLLNQELESRVAERVQLISLLNQELEASNEEIRASNEELMFANEALAENRNKLEETVAKLTASEYRTRNIIESVPFPIGVYSGREMRIEFLNQSIIDLWGKGGDLVGKLYAEVLPELHNQSVYNQLDQVYMTGQPFEARNQRIDLVVNGILTIFYFNYNFTALRNDKGVIYGVMNTAANVTDLFLAKQQLEEAAERSIAINEEMAAINEELTSSNEEMVAVNQQLNTMNEQLSISQDETELAINAAGLATFDLNPFTGRFSGNDLLKAWFGLTPDEEIELQKATNVVAEHDKEKVISAITRALEYSSGGDYDTYYSIINPKAPEPRIVRAKGKTLFNQDKIAVRLSGVLQDVTEQVMSQQKISEMNTRLNIAIEAGSLGSTEIELATGKMQPNVRFKACFGRTMDEEFNYADLFEAMLPQYRAHVKELVTIAKENQTVYHAEYEVQWPDGSVHWISAHGKARYDNNENAVAMVEIISDITEAKADEQRKNDFIGMVSHELKTPLTSLGGYLQLLHKKTKENQDVFISQALEKANNQLKKMTNMINSFLNVSRLESGKIHIEYQHFNLPELVSEVENEFSIMSNSHIFQFENTDSIAVNADRDKIGHVISNFISNAVKYSPTGSTITISCENIGKNIQVAVKDEGSGIREEDRHRLFERYYRVMDQRNTIAGFGIGLYLCAEIINRHNGEIGVESELGKGSTFYFTLPNN